MTDHGLLPSTNDIVATIVILAVYLLRIGGAGDPTIHLPTYLTVTTDTVLPAMAGAWMFCVAILVAIDRFDHQP